MPETILQPPARKDETPRFISAVFAAWRAAGLEFLVLRNYENLPEFTTNDIDVLVAPRNRHAAESLLLAAAGANGFRLHNRAEFATLACYFSSKTSTAQAHFDLFTTLKWRTLDFLRCENVLRQRVACKEFYVPRKGHEAAVNLLATMIYTGRVKQKYKRSIAEGFRTDEQAASALLTRSYGKSLSAALMEAGKTEDWLRLERLTPRLRRALLTRQMLGSPLRTLRSVANDTKRIFGRMLHPPGLVVVMCGPDGSGKSTVARLLQENLSPSFSPAKGRQYHWKVPVFSARRMAERAPTDDPHAQPPRGRLLSLLYFAVHWLEFVLGPRLALMRTLFRGGLVLIDRYYYDFFVDPRRYRLNVPHWLVHAGYLFVKKPDLVFLLDAPAEVLQQRKKEVPLEETGRQRNVYLRVIGALPQGRVLEATVSPPLVAARAERCVLDFLAARTESRLHRLAGVSDTTNNTIHQPLND